MLGEISLSFSNISILDPLIIKCLSSQPNYKSKFQADNITILRLKSLNPYCLFQCLHAENKKSRYIMMLLATSIRDLSKKKIILVFMEVLQILY